MSKNRHKEQGKVPAKPRQQQPVARQDMTPGRAPAEGPAIDSPSHERWEQDTADRAPAEGPEMP